MKVKIKIWISLFFVLVLLAGVSALLVRYYSYVFSKDVSGEVIGIERALPPAAILTNGALNSLSQVYSFAIAVRNSKGEIMTASTEDRQWAVVEKGKCVEAKYFPYPPWQLDRAGTYFGARLLRLYDCPK